MLCRGWAAGRERARAAGAGVRTLRRCRHSDGSRRVLCEEAPGHKAGRHGKVEGAEGEEFAR